MKCDNPLFSGREDKKALTRRIVSRMIKETTRQRLLRQAADHIGRDELAIRLKASASLVDAWIHGLATLPDRKFSLLADVLHNFAAGK